MALGDVSPSNKVYLIDGRRTPFGKFGGSLKKTSGLDLCLSPCKKLLEVTNIDPKSIDQVIVGNVIPSTTDMIYVSRHIGLHLGIGIEKPGYNLNRLCGSGIQSIMDAVNLIKLNEAECVLAGGVESMTTIPHLTYGARFGTKYGGLQSVDMLLDTLTDKYTGLPMAITAENMAEKYNITREECDDYSFKSHKKATKAKEDGHFKDEIVPFDLKKKQLCLDEHVRADASLKDFESLKSSFKKDGVVTPGTASGIVDGASFVIVASEKFVKENKIIPLAEIVDSCVVGVDPNFMGTGPVPAIEKLLKRNGYSVEDIDLFEINEAFAAQVISCRDELKIQDEKLNIWGGAISIGHPLGATGARITTTLSKQLKKKEKKLGIASACIGGGQGISILLKNYNE